MYNVTITSNGEAVDSMNTDRAGIAAIMDWIDRKGWTDTHLEVRPVNDEDRTRTGADVLSSLEENI